VVGSLAVIVNWGDRRKAPSREVIPRLPKLTISVRCGGPTASVREKTIRSMAEPTVVPEILRVRVSPELNDGGENRTSDPVVLFAGLSRVTTETPALSRVHWTVMS
jgi:hypothetical protein